MNSTSSPSPGSRLSKSRLSWMVVVVGVLAAGSSVACAFDAGEAAPKEFVATFEQQDFVETTMVVDGREARVTGYRTPTETRVSVELPAGVMVITQSVLRVDGRRIPARSFHNEGNVLATSFPATPFGTSFELELGTVAIFQGEQSSITVAMDDILKAADGAENFDVPENAILAGDRSRVVSGQQGKWGARKWIGLEIVGNWQSSDPDAPPHMFDGEGQRLLSAQRISSYRKDVNGVVSEGTTKIGSFVDGDSDLSQVTFVLGPSTVPDGQSYVVAVRPQ